MAILCMLYGQSGTGKSTSLRNFGQDDVFVINVSGKPFPFRNANGIKSYSTDSYTKLITSLPKCPQPSIVIDDATLVMVTITLHFTVLYNLWSKLAFSEVGAEV